MFFRVPLWAYHSHDFGETHETPGGKALAELVVPPPEEGEVVAARISAAEECVARAGMSGFYLATGDALAMAKGLFSGTSCQREGWAWPISIKRVFWPLCIGWVDRGV